MNHFGGICLSIALSVFCTSITTAEEPHLPRLVVHEWGVLTVGHVGDSPILGATDNFLASLPEFVLQHEHVPSGAEFTRPLIIRKPVIHLYGAEGQKIEIIIEIADGIPLVYYPKPDLATKITLTTTKDGHRGLPKDTPSMTWKFTLTKKDPGTLSRSPLEHWWNAARQITSDFVIMDDSGTSERFLFYEGTTVEKPKVIASVSEDSITVTNQGSAASSPVILILNDKGTRSGVYIDSIKSNAVENLTADEFKPWDEETLLANCRKQWVACGMTADEAAGIVESWRHELLDTPGFLLISRIPDPIYQKIFPIKVTPEPDELVRACLVFDSLPGQDGRKHWLPNLVKEGSTLIAQLSDPDFKTRLQAHALLVELGEVMSPQIREIVEDPSSDAQSKMAAGTLLELFTESRVSPHLPRSPVPATLHRGFVLPPPVPLIELDLKIVPIP